MFMGLLIRFTFLQVAQHFFTTGVVFKLFLNVQYE